MSNKRPLVPNFLNKLDEKLLKNNPETWSTRTHLVLYYGALFILALAGLCFIVPDDPRTNTGVANWITLLSIVALVAFIFWLIYLLRFNVFKRYGNTSAINRLKVFLLYFLSVGVIIFAIYVPAIVETTRANMAYGDEEIVNDINEVNMTVCKLEYDSLNHVWARDTVKVVDTLPGALPAPVNDYEDYTTVDTVTVAYPATPYNHRIIDTAELKRLVAAGDSITQINDSLYILLECPKYTFVLPYSYRAEAYTKQKVYTSKDIYKKLIRNFRPEYKMTAPADMKRLSEKYVVPERYNSGIYHDTYQTNPSYFDRVNRRYKLGNIEDSFSNIISRKYRFNDDELSVYIHVFFYITLALSLLTFIFRHSTVKTFFLSLLTAVLITVLTGLMMAFSGYSTTAFLGWCIFYCIVFFCIALTALKPATRNVVSGIALNLFVLMIYFLPMLVVGYYYEQLERTLVNGRPILINYEEKQLHMLFAEIGGFVLLLILIPTIIHHLYRKWYAAPEE